MNTISSILFNINNIQIGELEEKKSKSGETYRSSKLEYKYHDKLGRLSISSVELDPRKGGTVVFCGCRISKVMKFGTKDVWTGEYQMQIPLFQNPKAPSKDELKFVENMKQIRRRIAMELVSENGLEATDKEIEKALDEVKDPVSYRMKYATDSKGNVIILKNGKKKTIGVDDSYSPTMYVKLYTKKEEVEGAEPKISINTKFFDSNYDQIKKPEDLEGKLLDCCLELRFDSIYAGSNGFSIQIKVGEVGLYRTRELPPKNVSKLKGFMSVIPQLPPVEAIQTEDDPSDDD